MLYQTPCVNVFVCDNTVVSVLCPFPIPTEKLPLLGLYLTLKVPPHPLETAFKDNILKVFVVVVSPSLTQTEILTSSGKASILPKSTLLLLPLNTAPLFIYPPIL